MPLGILSQSRNFQTKIKKEGEERAMRLSPRSIPSHLIGYLYIMFVNKPARSDQKFPTTLMLGKQRQEERAKVKPIVSLKQKLFFLLLYFGCLSRLENK